jgi:SAM-dependent methyltransferase
MDLPEGDRSLGSQLTNAEYWSQVWGSSSNLPAPIDETDQVFREYCDFFKNVLDGQPGSLLEIGCGCSRWLPYFAKRGFRVSGIDYSPAGCEQARMLLERERCGGDIYEGDAFDPNPDLLGRFDVVVSMGVVEHFRETAEPVRAFSRYLKPGGLLISTCPNMAGLLGWSQKVLNRAVYDRHVPLTVEHLQKAHEMAGLTVTHCTYIGSLDFHVLNLLGANRPKQFAHRALMRLSRICWKLPLRVKRGLALSSAVGCAARQCVQRP